MNPAPRARCWPAIFERAGRQEGAREHYPAPYAIIDLWKRYGDKPALMMEKGGALDRRAVLQRYVAQPGAGVPAAGQAQGARRQDPACLRHVHVVGAGVMGGDIAAWCALRGMTVSLQDREPKYIAPVIKRARKLYEKKLRDPRLVRGGARPADAGRRGPRRANADVVIEAIFEDAEAKKALFRRSSRA
jgi:3-hydroxyacyl-CoA dehydrogenase / enoyl-CoA hydratase / 3-hydroxybutyryl-CoA epimerase